MSEMSRAPMTPSDKSVLRLDRSLALNDWVLTAFGVSTLDELAVGMKSWDSEGYDPENVSYFAHALCARPRTDTRLTNEKILEYDANIVRHWQHVVAAREEDGRSRRVKYFQYLGLLLCEIYLDRYFSDSDVLLDELNAHLLTFNSVRKPGERINAFGSEDLNKLASWSATGSGKTLMMHVNILQYRHYLDRAGRTAELNRVLVLTPNEGLSRQHLRELDKTQIPGLPAQLFVKDGGSLFSGHTIEILDIHKLSESGGEKTVAVDAFEGNNLVLVDEGHRGASGEDWKAKRDKLCAEGFSFEYSATFGQAIKASGKDPLFQEYARCILFDYSYRYFYRDGYGKDYRILNLADDSDDGARELYLTACLLSFYEQQRLYDDHEAELIPYLVERPLWVFVGSKVNAVARQGGRDVSDVVDVLLFLARFVSNRAESVARLKRLIGGRPGVLDSRGQEIFGGCFLHVASLGLSSDAVFDDVMARMFNSGGSGRLHVVNLKGSDGEIALKIGACNEFGVINVGDKDALAKMCRDYDELVVEDQPFARSLFNKLAEADSTVNILIGSKKFIEGWDSYRVSTMGLMNVGRSEGSEIIQLFGRGVRLKGHDNCLKRSNFVDGIEHPEGLRALETLNVFGIRANYMADFRRYLEEEGVPASEDWQEVTIPVEVRLPKRGLKVPALKLGTDFKREVPEFKLAMPFEALLQRPVEVDWYPRVQALASADATFSMSVQSGGGRVEQVFGRTQREWLDWRKLYLDLLSHRRDRKYTNLVIEPQILPELLAWSREPWHRLYAPRELMEWHDFGGTVARWQEMALALLRKYVDRFYALKKAEYERPNRIYRELREGDANLPESYRLKVLGTERELFKLAEGLRDIMSEPGIRTDLTLNGFDAIFLGEHVYEPLLAAGELLKDVLQVQPAPLNHGELLFARDLQRTLSRRPELVAGCEVHLLRNLSRGKGLTFSEAGNFYPDFILWVCNDQKQYVTFVDPHGMAHADGLTDPKVQLHRSIKEIESVLAGGSPGIVLNSFIVSVTAARNLTFQATQAEFEENNVVFQQDPEYVAKILRKVLHGDAGEVALLAAEE